MAKSFNQKLKLLYIMQYFMENTDENHGAGTQDIIQMLAGNGINAERKSIYDDIEALKQYGLDIIHRREQPSGYYLASRSFELPELKLLVDSVQASKFITTKKSNELIKKLEGLASRYEAAQLQRQVFVTNRIKTMNESIYYNVDKIHMAISNNTMIQFQYFEWTVLKETRLRRDGKIYVLSPWALSWEGENYYMIGFDGEAGIIKHFRVDKMLGIESRQEEREGKEIFQDFDIAKYARSTFGMYGGYEERITLRCKNNLVGVMIDRFGKDTIILKDTDEAILVKVDVVVSGPFFGWLTTLGGAATIIGPEKVVREYEAHLEGILKRLKESVT